MKTQIIFGAGPTGLNAAICLSETSQVLIFEKRDDVNREQYVGFDGKTINQYINALQKSGINHIETKNSFIDTGDLLKNPPQDIQIKTIETILRTYIQKFCPNVKIGKGDLSKSKLIFKEDEPILILEDAKGETHQLSFQNILIATGANTSSYIEFLSYLQKYKGLTGEEIEKECVKRIPYNHTKHASCSFKIISDDFNAGMMEKINPSNLNKAHNRMKQDGWNKGIPTIQNKNAKYIGASDKDLNYIGLTYDSENKRLHITGPVPENFTSHLEAARYFHSVLSDLFPYIQFAFPNTENIYSMNSEIPDESENAKGNMFNMEYSYVPSPILSIGNSNSKHAIFVGDARISSHYYLQEGITNGFIDALLVKQALADNETSSSMSQLGQKFEESLQYNLIVKTRRGLIAHDANRTLYIT